MNWLNPESLKERKVAGCQPQPMDASSVQLSMEIAGLTGSPARNARGIFLHGTIVSDAG